MGCRYHWNSSITSALSNYKNQKYNQRSYLLRADTPVPEVTFIPGGTFQMGLKGKKGDTIRLGDDNDDIFILSDEHLA